MESLLAPFGTTPDKLLLKDLKTHKEVQAPRPPQEILDAQFQPAGQHLLLFTRDNALPGQPTGLELRNRATGELVRTIAHPKEYAAARPVYSANGTRLMTPKGLRAAVVCDATTGQELATFQVPIPSLQLWAFALSGDGKRYACAAQTGRIWIGDVATNRLIADGSIAHDQATSLFSLAFNREGTLLAGGWANGKVTISKVPDPPSQGVPNRMKFPLRFFLDSHTAPVVSVCFSPLGDRLLSGSETGEALLWDTATGQETIEFKLPNADRLHRVQFSADGHRIALIGRTFGAVVLDGSPRK
jgi:WD40 repeat protein